MLFNSMTAFFRNTWGTALLCDKSIDIQSRYYTPPSSSNVREIDENTRREIAFRLKPIGPYAVNMRDTGNYFVLSVLPSSAGNPLQLMRTIKSVGSTAVIILRPENVDRTQFAGNSSISALPSAIIHEHHNFCKIVAIMNFSTGHLGTIETFSTNISQR